MKRGGLQFWPRFSGSLSVVRTPPGGFNWVASSTRGIIFRVPRGVETLRSKDFDTHSRRPYRMYAKGHTWLVDSHVLRYQHGCKRKLGYDNLTDNVPSRFCI